MIFIDILFLYKPTTKHNQRGWCEVWFTKVQSQSVRNVQFHTYTLYCCTKIWSHYTKQNRKKRV